MYFYVTSHLVFAILILVYVQHDNRYESRFNNRRSNNSVDEGDKWQHDLFKSDNDTKVQLNPISDLTQIYIMVTF